MKAEATEALTKDTLEKEGTVEEVLPKAMFHVRLDDGRVVRAGLGASSRHGIVRLIEGDRVRVKVSPIDPRRASVLRKL